MKTLGYAVTGLNPHLSIYQFQNNGVDDFDTPKLWLNIMGCGPCMDAPEAIPTGCHSSRNFGFGTQYIEPRG